MKLNASHILIGAAAFFMLTMKATARAASEEIAEGMMGKYFSAEEVVKSATAETHNIIAQFNPPDSVWNAAYLLTQKVLDPIRHFLGHPVTVESWYRSRALTEALLKAGEDTVPNTTHVTGGTADLTFILNGENKSGLIVRAALVTHVPFDRLLIEHGTLDAPNHIHIEFDPEKSDSEQRREIWRITHGAHGQKKSIAWAEDYYL